MKILILLVTSISFVGCASYFTRKQCEKTNWFQHGHDVAMQGKRVSADDFVQQCEKVEAQIDYANLDLGFKKGMGNYCKPKTVYNLGKKGESFREEMCDGGPVKKLIEQYNSGLQVFCQPKNGQIFGAKGGIYKDVCPKDMEESFLKQYRKGRVVYLEGLVKDMQGEIATITQDLQRKRREKETLTYTLANLKGGTQVTVKTELNPVTKKYGKKTVVEEDEATKSRRQQLEMKINTLDREIRSKEARLNQLKSEVQSNNQEIRALNIEVAS